MLNISGLFIAQELQSRGYKVTEFDDDMLYMAEKDGRHHFFHSVKTDQMNALAYLICQNKWYTKQILQHFGIPTARAQVLHPQQNQIHVDGLQFPLVLKPLTQYGGEGVAVDIKDDQEVQHYVDQHNWYKSILAEETLHGEDYRITTINGKFFAACRRVPASLVGDGEHTIHQLFVLDNERRQRLLDEDISNHTHSHDVYIMAEDEEVARTLQEQQLNSDSVVPTGQTIWLRRNANVSTGGVSVDVTDQVCPALRAVSEQICDILHAGILGIDIMTEDLGQPLDLSKGWGVVEVNGSPGYSLHSLVHVGQRRDPVKMIVDEWEKNMAA